MSTMWLSFVNDEGFAGVVLVDLDERLIHAGKVLADQKFPGHKDTGAVTAALGLINLNKVNPGGEVMGWELPDEVLPKITEWPRLTILSRERMEELGMSPMSLREYEESKEAKDS